MISDEEAPDELTREAGASLARARREEESAQRALAGASAKARRAGRGSERAAEQLELLPDEVLAALAARPSRKAAAAAEQQQQGGEPRARHRRTAEEPQRAPRPGQTLRASNRLAVTVLSRVEDILATAGSGPSEAAAAFLRERVVSRRKRSRDMLVATRFGVPVDFAGEPAKAKRATRA